MFRNCGHKCHDPEIGLNAWVAYCPICGCANPAFDPAARSDILIEPYQGLGELNDFIELATVAAVPIVFDPLQDPLKPKPKPKS